MSASAPVNEPLSWPNSSLSSSVSCRAAQLIVTSGMSRRGLLWCNARATSSLPAPLGAADQDRGIGPCDLFHHGEYFLHRRTVADHLQPRRLKCEMLDLLFQANVFDFEPAHMHGSQDRGHDDGKLERLEDIVERAELHGINRGLHRALTGHNDSDDVRIDLQRLAQELDAVHFGHHQVAQEQVEVAFAKLLDGFLRRRESLDEKVLRGERIAQRPHQFHLVVHDKNSTDMSLVHVQNLIARAWSAVPKYYARWPRATECEWSFLFRARFQFGWFHDAPRRFGGRWPAPTRCLFLRPWW